ncbi:MAG: helicase HerA-like domain-containing protein [Acutalibacteraceae bacterium]|nr:helicase HerA-like domain-containing protein [Acutalibacteraceae bacterium]
MIKDGKILLAKSEEKEIYLYPKMANRHGLIAGVTGSGKTITLKVLAEAFSSIGVPVFMADVKGDLGSVSKMGVPVQNVESRIEKMGLDDFYYDSFPTRFWDLKGENGHPVRTTVSDMGAVLISRLLGLSDAQEGVLDIVFRIADDKGWPLIDLKDLRTMLNYVGENRKEYITQYGNIAVQSVGGILRSLIRLEDEGGNLFFGEPAFDFNDWFTCDENGKGYINILHSVNIIQTPTIYSFFLLWLLSDLFEKLPEVGDCQKPKLVFFFDEAHLLFNDMPNALLEKIVQVVKLIRSKGVGVYFISQSPGDIPNPVLAQLNNRVQHTLHAYTPAEQKAVHTAAASFRVNPKFDTEQVISQLGIGEALVSTLQEDGTPSVVERCKILPPQSFMGTITKQERQAIIDSSTIKGKYDVMLDNRSAYEEILGLAVQGKAEDESVDSKYESTVSVSEQPKTASAADSEIWVCKCGTENKTKFCTECGAAKPRKKKKSVWLCECNHENTGKFCGNCGKKKPEDNTWTCSCGTVNKSKFCIECGQPKTEKPTRKEPTAKKEPAGRKESSGMSERPRQKEPAGMNEQWLCMCGNVNVGPYCYQCGSTKDLALAVKTPKSNPSPAYSKPEKSKPNNRELSFSEKIARGLFGSKK